MRAAQRVHQNKLRRGVRWAISTMSPGSQRNLDRLLSRRGLAAIRLMAATNAILAVPSAVVAQVAEHRPRNAEVARSIRADSLGG